MSWSSFRQISEPVVVEIVDAIGGALRFMVLPPRFLVVLESRPGW
jgi:hypothetical protein